MDQRSPTRAVSADLGRSPDDGLNVEKLIASSPSAWGESSYRIRNVLPAYTPGQDLKGELGVMVISERLKPANLDFSVKGGRLAVIGTADLVTNNRIINVGNLNLFLATVNWTVDRDTDELVDDIAHAGKDSPALRMDLEAALERLGDTSRAVVWLHDVEGYTHDEIANMMGKTVSFSKSQLARAHTRLRRWLGEEVTT